MKKKGFTLVEILIATVILALLITFAAGVSTNFFNSLRNLKATNTVYQESRFLMEKIVQEIRNGAVDYEEYFDKSSLVFGTAKTYGDNYCKYSRQFYSAGLDGEFGTNDDKNTGKNNATPALSQNIQNELYLIDGSGTQRTYLKRIEGVDGGNNPIGQVGIVRLIGRDYGIDHLPADPASGRLKDNGEEDGFVDTWVCDDDFTCATENGLEVMSDESFRPITPTQIDVTSLRFIIAPKDDPRKGFNAKEIQIQPHVTLQVTVRAGKRIAQGFGSDEAPTVTFESTVSTRVYNEVVAQCALKECENGQEQACPLSVGVCASATQVCAQSVWPGCNEDAYRNFVLRTEGEDLYEHQKETTCDDDLDNDCDGFADEFDPDCIQTLCTNGIRDSGLAPLTYEPKDNLTEAIAPDPNDVTSQDEKCIDVGGLCDPVHRYEKNGETLCYDDYDNDCNYDPAVPGTGADEFDRVCVDVICTNKKQDNANCLPGIKAAGNCSDGGLASTDPLQARDYLIRALSGEGEFSQDEAAADVGGLCAGATIPHPLETPEVSCGDGLDNDADDLLDALDPDCQSVLCSNGVKDADEVCMDAGGLCGKLIENTAELCRDNIDNDCNDFADFQDRFNCCPDATSDQDADGFKVEVDACFPPPEKTDCLDTNPLVHPPNDPPRAGELEEEVLCYDTLDNDCDGTPDGADPGCCTDFDGDTYGTADNLASCSGSTTLADCNDLDPTISPAKMERCDDVIENNCNGLEGTDDEYCLFGNNLTFFDNLSGTVWKSGETTALWDGNGSVTIDPPEVAGERIAVSKILLKSEDFGELICGTGVKSATLHAEANVPPGTSLRFRLTNNEDDWVDAVVDEAVEFPDPFKRKLRWQAILEGDGLTQAPELQSVTLDYTCN